jgi:hypothetical protein
MAHFKSWFVAVLFLSACGGTPKEPAQTPPETDPKSVSEPKAETTEPKTEQPKPEAQPEPDATCEKDSDCTIFTDCCTCRAVSQKAPLPPSCEGICGESKCEVKGKTIANVACVSGKCKLK